jgi:hypothetical protein
VGGVSKGRRWGLEILICFIIISSSNSSVINLPELSESATNLPDW